MNKDQPRWQKVNNTDEFPYSTIGVVSFENTEGLVHQLMGAIEGLIVDKEFMNRIL